MKKYLVVLAALAMVLVGCKDKDKDGGSEYTKISIKQSEITLAAGETYKLNLLYEPTTLDAPACTWSSSNAEVATVANGTVTAVAPGEATITAKLGELSAACKVIVKTVYGAYEIEDYGVFGTEPDSVIAGTDTLINLPWAGGAFNCQLAFWPVLAWDGDLTYVSGSGFQGAGLLLYSTVPFYTINDENAGQDNGTPVGWGSFNFKDVNGKARRNNVGQAGKMDRDKYCEYMDSYITELLAEGDGSNIKWDLFPEAIDPNSAIIFVADYTAEEPEWEIDYGLVRALVKDMELVWDAEAEAFSYTATIDWFNNLDENHYFGLAFTKEGVTKPYDLSIITEEYTYGNPVNNAPALNEPYKLKHYKEIPEIRLGRKVVTDMLIKK